MDRRHMQSLGHVRRPQSPDELLTLSPQQTVSLQKANAAQQQSEQSVPLVQSVPAGPAPFQPQAPVGPAFSQPQLQPQSQPQFQSQPQPQFQPPLPQSQPQQGSLQQANVTAPEQVRFAQQQALQPQQQPSTGAALSTSGRRGMSSLLKAVIGLIGVAAVGILLFVALSLFGGSETVGTLVQDQRDGISFSRPEAWTNSVIENQYAYYTKGGADIADSAEGIALRSDFIGLKFESLGVSEKETIRESFEAQFSSAESFFRSGECSEVGESKTTEVQQNGYDIAYLFEASCVRTSTDEPGGRVKMFIGWTDVNLHLFGVAADISTWENDAETLDMIIGSVRPVN